jgi:hypothetical protein
VWIVSEIQIYQPQWLLIDQLTGNFCIDKMFEWWFPGVSQVTCDLPVHISDFIYSGVPWLTCKLPVCMTDLFTFGARFTEFHTFTINYLYVSVCRAHTAHRICCIQCSSWESPKVKKSQMWRKKFKSDEEIISNKYRWK